jgi:hypothetical protein
VGYRIVRGSSLTEANITDLAALCKQGRQAAVAEDVLTPAYVQASHFPGNLGAGQPVSLAAIKNVSFVNKPAPGQTLSFRGDGITLV